MKRSVIALVLLLTSCSGESDLAVRGDSTAIATRGGLAKIYTLAPSFDGSRWWNVVAATFAPKRIVFNDGVGGQTVAAMRDKMIADDQHRQITTIIYDRRNTGEEAEAYVAALSEAILTLETKQFLIMPQVPRSISFPESADQIEAMKRIDDAVLTTWPLNTFSTEEREAFNAALSKDSTRFDGLHRNAEGQSIEAEFISKWLNHKKW